MSGRNHLKNRQRLEILEMAREVLRIEADGILHLLEQVSEDFVTAVQWILAARGRVIVTASASPASSVAQWWPP